MSEVDKALSNLNAIKSGKDPRFEDSDLTFIDQDDLPYYHDDAVRERQDVIDKFVEFVNVCEPRHSYLDDPYPVSEHQIDVSYCTNESDHNATCGPRMESHRCIAFSFTTDVLCRADYEKMLNILVHELTHVSCDFHGSCWHSPEFWSDYAKNVRTLMDSGLCGDPSKFASYCVYNAHSGQIDNRRVSQEEQRDEIKRILLQ